MIWRMPLLSCRRHDRRADSPWLIILRFYFGFAAGTVLADRRFGGGSWDKQS